MGPSTPFRADLHFAAVWHASAVRSWKRCQPAKWRSIMPSSVKEMLAAANSAVPRVPPAEARALIDRGNALIVDVRDPSEVQASGKIKGAVNVSRGMLEFRAEPESPFYNDA